MAIRILDILNFSNRRNPDADSGIQLQKELISCVLSKRPDFLFYILLPTELVSLFQRDLHHSNVQLIPINLVARQQGGAFHFDVHELRKLLEFKKIDFDVLFVNQPELTPALLEFFNKVHFFDIHSFGYVHWMDWKRHDNIKNRWNIPATISILTSILLSRVTGCNSLYGKGRILSEAKRWFNSAAIHEIEKKLIPIRPGVNCREILSARSSKRSGIKTIIFPFRAQKYTGFKSLVETHLAQLWERRRDFRLLLTNPSDYDYVKNYPKKYPFVNVRRFDRKDYLKALWEADIVAGCHDGSNQWSLAAIEALAAECIPLFNKSSFFPEMVLEGLPSSEHDNVLQRYFYYRGTFSVRLEALFDNLDKERQRIRTFSRRIRAFYDWETRVEDWIRYFELTDAATMEITRQSQVVSKIEALIKKKGGCTKEAILKHLNWHPKSRHISWTKYRRYLRRCFFEDLNLREVFFAPKAQRSRGRS